MLTAPRRFRPGLTTLVLFFFLAACTKGEEGSLQLRIRDAGSGAPTPARIELLDEHGEAVIPDQALPVFEDCGNIPVHNWAPWTARVQALWHQHREVRNPYSDTIQFYTA